MKKAKKSRSCTAIVKGKVREVNFNIGSNRILTIKENSLKSLRKWYKNGLTYTYKHRVKCHNFTYFYGVEILGKGTVSA